ncbi:glycosyltransferase family 4 protein [Pedobacter sp. UYP24]
MKITIVLIAHGTEIWRPLSWWKTKFIKIWVVIWSVSHHTKKEISKKHNLDARRIHVLHNCLNPFLALPKSFEKPKKLLERYHLTKSQKIILTISRITKHEHDKGYENILKLLPCLLSKFPDLHYIICGKIDNDEIKRLIGIIELLNLKDHVTITGFIPNEELSIHYSLCDAFIMPSKKEGFGLVFIEAAACGCNVIAGNKDGSIEAIMYGKLGIAVDPDNPIKLEKAIRHTLKNQSSASSYKRQQLCVNNFHQSRYQQKVLKLLK